MRGEEDSTDLQSDGATGSGTATGSGMTTRTPTAASRLKAGSGTGLATVRHRGRRRGRGQGWRRCDVEGGDRGTEGGGVDGAASWEAAA
jgi:hypothetical protein